MALDFTAIDFETANSYRGCVPRVASTVGAPETTHAKLRRSALEVGSTGSRQTLREQ
jgi:hypothetical protein